ncbi:MAG: 2-amino-4-hydroxy-6-hydroxymethyldihydropteridine diphosphokinase [Thermosipho sp. (in: Bacteria)]|nr:2-amino-4-hydroxy-6-hydroxymethyldihydropteridine diphosphokinase [Thermosipho sp. (in: thermotogales)]
MIVGLGNDILEIQRVNVEIERRILTDLEKNKRKLDAQYIAGRFSLKEAFFKALGTGIGGNSFKDISFLNNENGKPYAVFHKEFDGFNFCHVSLSHDEYVISTVILEKVEGNIFLGLGSNIGDKEKNLRVALKKLKANGLRLVNVSSLYITEPYGYVEQDVFYNIVVEIDSNLPYLKLLNLILKIENEMGRKRLKKWGPRNIDIDILFYGNLVVEMADLKIPHYDFENRDFFIAPMYELSEEFKHPISMKTMRDYYVNLKEKWKKIDWSL